MYKTLRKFIRMNFFTLSALFFVYVYLLRKEAGCDTLGSGSALDQGKNYMTGSVKDLGKELTDQPENKNSSIKYWVFTPRSPKTPCFLEPNEEDLKNCSIDPKIPIVFLIHGFVTELNPGNLFEILKDVLLERGEYTVIIVDWSKYDGPPYELAIKHMKVVGGKVADLIKYLVEHAGVSTDNVTIIGHSLGAQMAGFIGKNLSNLYRIVALDPAGPEFETSLMNSRLSHTDANWVQVLHSSNEVNDGLGLKEAIGHMDVYINGGERQPHCHYGNMYRRPSGDDITIDSLTKMFCHHEMVLIYYINTINQTECKFHATNCGSFEEFKKGRCPPDSSKVGDMGFFSSPIKDMPPNSKFYMRTSSKSPYCIKNGHKAF